MAASTHIGFEDQLYLFTEAWRLRYVGRIDYDRMTGTHTNGLLVPNWEYVAGELAAVCDIPVTERRLRTAVNTFRHASRPFPSTPKGLLRQREEALTEALKAVYGGGARGRVPCAVTRRNVGRHYPTC